MTGIPDEFDIISAATVCAWLGFLLWASYAVFWGGATRIYAENALIETIQACVLAIACLVYLVTAVLEKRSDKPILLACCLLCYLFVLRELDVEKFDLPQAVIFVGSGIGRNASVALGFVAIFIYAVFNDFSFYLAKALEFARSRPGVLLMTGGLCLLFGQFFEKNDTIRHHVFFEEIVELSGYVFILLSSIATNSLLRGLALKTKH